VGQAGEPDGDIVELSELPFAQVAACDERHFGFARESFLRPWINPVGGRALGVLREDRLVAMGVLRPCREGFKIGPLFADDVTEAERVYVALSAHATGQPIFLDTPENNPAALALAAKHGLTEVFGCARMYHGPAPALPWSNIYGVTTFELG
jgi:hypothetical protein